MTRKCSHCKQILDESEFNWKIKDIKRSYHCKKCSRLYLKSHYKRNLQYYLNKARKRDQQTREKGHEYIGNYLMSHSCIDCGEKDILVLEFDHRERDHKIGEISRIISRGFSFEKLVDEISKCEIRCANCHRRKTERENNSWKLKYAPVA